MVRQRPAKPLPPVRIRASPPGNIRALRRPFCFTYADMAQLVEHNLAKVGVAGSSPVVRSIWAFSSGGERFPDTEEVRSSNLLTPTKCSQLRGYVLWAVLFCHQARRQTSHQILIQGLYAMVFASRRGAGRLHTSWPIVTATCWSSTIFWILLA